MTVRIVIREGVFIKGLPLEMENLFCSENTFPNPKIETLTRLGKWTGNTPKDIKLWRKKDDWISLPRGYESTVLDTLNSSGIEFTIEYAFPNPLPFPDITPTGKLFDYQETALKQLLKYETGSLVAPVGAGKTELMLSLITDLCAPSLILVHTTGLLNQTVERCETWLNYIPGIYGAGKKIIKDITVAMVQTIVREQVSRIHPLYGRFGCLIQDELHHAPSVTFTDVITRFPCRYKYGFTATPFRKDKLEKIIFRVVGPIRAKVPVAVVQNAGRCIWPEIIPIYTNFYYHVNSADEWTKLVNAIAEDPDRNAIICRTVIENLEGNGLVLTDRIGHAEILSKMLSEFSPVLLTGNLTRRQREESMNRIKAGVHLTIGTIHLLGEGLSINRWNQLFLVSPIVGGSRTIQALGRITRPYPGKTKAQLFDFIDIRVPMLKQAARKRFLLYEGRGGDGENKQ